MGKTMQNIIALGIGALFVFGVIATDSLDANSTPLVVTILGYVALIINSRVSSSRVETKVDKVLNGAMEAKIETALKKVLDQRGYEGNNEVTGPKNSGV